MLGKDRKDQVHKEAQFLVEFGTHIRYAQSYRINSKPYSGDSKIFLEKLEKKYPLIASYQNWYTKCLSFLVVFGKDRIEEFRQLYQLKTRKEINVTTYGISDYLQGITTTIYGETRTYDSTFASKMEIQIDIIKSVADRIDSVFQSMAEEIRFDVLQSELSAAGALTKAGFSRAGGVLAGVALEAHLSAVCDHHGVSPKKKEPTLNDLSQALKDGDFIETAQWRFIQHLSDVRNKCAHHKASEPSKEEVVDMITGVEKIMKTVG